VELEYSSVLLYVEYKEVNEWIYDMIVTTFQFRGNYKINFGVKRQFVSEQVSTVGIRVSRDVDVVEIGL